MTIEGFPQVATVGSPGHTVVRVSGIDPLAFLQDTTTQDLVADHGALSCLLDGTGHVLSVFRVLPLGDSVLLDGAPGSGDALVGWLARVAPLSGCEVTDESALWNVTMIRGAKAADALPGRVPETEHGFVVHDEAIVARVAWGIGGFDVLSKGRIAAQTMAPDTWEQWRIAAHIPVFGVDITAGHIVNETPLLARAVSPDKGCYPGQETVAKIRTLGRARRAVVGLHFDAEAPAPGAYDSVSITSSAGADAIATVRAEAVAAGAVAVAGRTAEVRAI